MSVCFYTVCLGPVWEEYQIVFKRVAPVSLSHFSIVYKWLHSWTRWWAVCPSYLHPAYLIIRWKIYYMPNIYELYNNGDSLTNVPTCEGIRNLLRMITNSRTCVFWENSSWEKASRRSPVLLWGMRWWHQLQQGQYGKLLSVDCTKW